MAKSFNDNYQFRQLFLEHIQFCDGNRDSKIFSASELATNLGLYKALSTYLITLYTTLGTIKDLGNELDSEDEQSAQKCKREFKKHFPTNKLDKLLQSPNDSKIRKYFLIQLRQSKYLYYHVTDKANPTYHNKHCYTNIILVNHQKIYTNALAGYVEAIKEYKTDLNIKNNPKKVTKNKHEWYVYFRQSTIPWAHKVMESLSDINTSLKYDKKEVNELSAKAKAIIKQHNISNKEPFKVINNPNASDDTDMPRIMTINNNKFYYDPKHINKKYIIYNNIPHLGKGIDNQDVDVIRATKNTIEEY